MVAIHRNLWHSTTEDADAIRSAISSNGGALVLTTVSPDSGTLITMTE